VKQNFIEIGLALVVSFCKLCSIKLSFDLSKHEEREREEQRCGEGQCNCFFILYLLRRSPSNSRSSFWYRDL
jgi:hypothetical protein